LGLSLVIFFPFPFSRISVDDVVLTSPCHSLVFVVFLSQKSLEPIFTPNFCPLAVGRSCPFSRFA
jgi:hypothetical protein